ncbi:CBS domain-containing protein [bacterium]|nr:CBS domain-containing protein [bacterium]
MDAEDIMTPRTKIEAFDGNLTLQQATDKILLFSHSRIPVYESTIDNVKYVVTLRDLMQFSKTHDKEEKLQNLPLKEIIKIPNTQPIHKLLQNLQSSRTQVAIVIDEYGGTA